MKEVKGIKRDNNFKRKFIIYTILAVLVLFVANYVTNENSRSFINQKILRKELEENNIKYIEINSEEKPDIYAYSKYITVFSKNELKIYDSSASNIKTLNIEISRPLKNTNGKYLLMAENEGKNIYLIEDTNIVWKNEIEGKISKINVNENGYVTVISTNNTYKSVIYVYNPDGTELFKKFLSSALAVTTDISKDNKHLLIGTIDYSGISAKSGIEVISMELAIKDSQNSTEKKYEIPQGKILIDSRYNSNNNIIVMCDDSIIKYYKDEEKEIFKISEDDIFVDIGLKNTLVAFSKETSGLFSFEYKTVLKDEETENENIYVLNKTIPKDVITNKSIVAMNFGTQVKIINSSAWLLKEYKSSKQIKELVLGTSVAGIVYKDKVEVINF